MAEKIFEEEEISLIDLINVIKKRIRFILIFTISVTFVSIVISLLLPKQYEAKAILRIGKMGGSILESASVTKEIITSFPELEKIAKELKIQPTERKLLSLKRKIKIEGKENLMNITTRYISPEKAEKLCNAVIKLILERHEKLYENLKGSLKKSLVEINPLSGRMQIIISALRDFSEEKTVIDSPTTSSKIPVFPKKRKIVISVFAISLITSIFISFFMEGLERNKK
ncbi:MAG: Wzz/FepE/Etk N-terminal domain-containing protein [Endomicrobiia bacterium]